MNRRGGGTARAVLGSIVAGSRAAFYWTIKTIVWPVTRLYVRMRVEGADNVPHRGGLIIVANHASFVDPIVLGSACPRRIHFLITEPIYRLLRLRWFYYMMGAIPVAPDTPDPSAMKLALRTLRNGGVIGIFPEGQRMADGRVGSGKAGVSLLAARSGVPVMPAAIIGAHRVMPVGSVFPRPHRIRVRFGASLRFPAWDGRSPSKEQLHRFAERIMDAIRDLLGEAAPETGAGQESTGTAGR